jgi:hypothetical protein
MKWSRIWHTIISIGVIGLVVAKPTIQQLVATNPVVSIGVTLGWGIFGHWLPSPLQNIFNDPMKGSSMKGSK